MDDWDWDADNANSGNSNFINSDKTTSPNDSKTNEQFEAPVSIIFGNRGRGFSRAERLLKPGANIRESKNIDEEWSDREPRNKNEGWSDNNERYTKHDSNDNQESERESRHHSRRYDDFQRGNTKNLKKDDGEIRKNNSKTTYIPDEPTENEEEIYGNGISSGINFSKYDDIKVIVSGENPPKAISSFETVGLQSHLVDIIKKCNYKKPTPIQKYAIPIIMNGRDLMACAQTGSGKTAAFLIPIINMLLENKEEDFRGTCKPKVIVLSPTRELAIQIFNEARKFSFGTFLKVSISYGGTSVLHQSQNIKGCHILVATPGRLLDFLKKGRIDLSGIRFLVLDEADRMLDLGFLPDMEKLFAHETLVNSSERQTLMFSATFPEAIQNLAGRFLNQYLFLAVGIIGGACSDVEQKFFSLSKFEKREKLIELLKENGSSKCLVFVEQKKTADFIATLLSEKHFPATSIHGDREQREREEALRDFKSGRMDILVATSVAARGLDIKNVNHVVNFDLPKTVDEYVHRIGRTGRVGNRGLATSFFDPKQDSPLACDLVKVLSQAGQEVPDFLKDEFSNDSVSTFSRFEGRDCRKQEMAENEYLISSQKNTYEDEVW